MQCKNVKNMKLVAYRQSYSENNRVTSFFLRHSVDCRLSPAAFDIGPTVYAYITQ